MYEDVMPEMRDGMMLVVVSGPVGGDSIVRIKSNNTVGALVSNHLRHLGCEYENISANYTIEHGRYKKVPTTMLLSELFEGRSSHLKVKINLRPGVPSVRTTETLFDKMQLQGKQ